MTDRRAPVLERAERRLRTLLAPAPVAWTVFVAVHLLLSVVNLVDTRRQPMGDVTGVYLFWMETALSGGPLVGVDTVWVYPIGALLPIALPMLAGSAGYGVAWLVMVTLLDAVAFHVLLRRNRTAAWWWLAFIALLGPIALGRLDTVAMALSIIAVVELLGRPGVAGVLLAVATWIKVWPAALVAAAVIALRTRLRILAAGAATTAVVLVLAIAAGGGGAVLTFITEQTGRGVQVEAPVATPWLWMEVAGFPGTGVYYDTGILTWQVRGPGIDVAAAVMTPMLALVVAGLTVLMIAARRRGVPATALLPEYSVALVAALIAVNKVGSPQYMTWLAAPVVLCILWQGRRARPLALLVWGMAGLTQLVYPWFYTGVLTADPTMLTVLTVRNVLEVALLVGATWQLVAAARGRRRTDLDLHVVLPTR